MIIFEYLILGLIQGLTEFLPVSSSGHLVILQGIFNMENRLLVSVSLHAGTLLALVLFFKRDTIALLKDSLKLLKIGRRGFQKEETSPRIIAYILIVTLVTGLIGLGGRDFFERLFFQPRWA
ncbi:undecaprenyl-diphosphate phosphatase, partial [candidate division NPL-UPA2 bacterium]|nr:undecaprenyl-diphosphate phosphatase [candidate division NPL-UPA2 bacterium]